MEYNVLSVANEFNRGKHLKYIFFWKNTQPKDNSIDESCLSQWYNCSFTVDNITYNTAEQYMMSKKALLFHDIQTFERIMNADNPNQYKRLGRKVKDFDIKVWKSNRFNIVLDGNLAKFSQNQGLKDFLLSTKNRVLVEASPYDTIWGIGLSADTPNIENPYT
ncbi:MAG: NADAR family protein [Ruminococcus sp.]|nr:NADAR family protein [Ruminococcus sp.]